VVSYLILRTRQLLHGLFLAIALSALRSNFLCFARDGRSLWGAPYQSHEVISLNWPELTLRSVWPNGAGGNRSLICLAVGNRWVLAGSRDESTKLLRVADGQLEHAWPSPGRLVQSVALG
jgi:hypothetical protein